MRSDAADGYLGDWLPHKDKCRCTDCQLERVQAENASLREQLARLQWRPIMETDLPKVGDEAYSCHDGDFLHVHTCDIGLYSDWRNEGWTHFRAINAPEAK